MLKLLKNEKKKKLAGQITQRPPSELTMEPRCRRSTWLSYFQLGATAADRNVPNIQCEVNPDYIEEQEARTLPTCCIYSSEAPSKWTPFISPIQICPLSHCLSSFLCCLLSLSLLSFITIYLSVLFYRVWGSEIQCVCVCVL